MIVEDVQRHAVADDAWELSAQLRGSSTVPDRRVWMRFSGDGCASGAPAGKRVDGSPFVVALTLVAMLARESLIVDAPVSARLLDHLPGVQDYYRAWYRGRIDEIKVDAPPETLAPGPPTTACCFSGGVDSWYTLLRAPADPPITVALTVGTLHNRFDGAERAARLAEVERLAVGRGLRPVLVETNLVEAVAGAVHQFRVFGPTLISAGLALGMQRLVLATSKSIRSLGMWNSHPLLDPHWSTERTEVVHHGIEASRIEKLATIANSDVPWSAVHVCLMGSTNCGRCEKCIRTMVELHLVGVDPQEAFPRPLDALAVARCPLPKSRRWFWEDIESELSRRANERDLRLLLAVRSLLLRDDLAKERRKVRRWASTARRVAWSR